MYSACILTFSRRLVILQKSTYSFPFTMTLRGIQHVKHETQPQHLSMLCTQ
jgi:hypothetical protein